MRLFFLFIALFLLPLSEINAELSEQKRQDTFTEANKLFEQANGLLAEKPETAKKLFLQSAGAMEKIINENNVRNGKLYYNLGNAYARADEIGKAILNYKRAELYIPQDINLKNNLSYVLSRKNDLIEEKQQHQMLKTIFFLHYDLSTNTRSLIFVTVSIVFWILAVVKIFKPKLFPNWILIATAVLCTTFLTSVVADSLALANNNRGVIIADKVIGRKGDNHNYEPSFREPLHVGTQFKLKETRGTWYNIELLDGNPCWIPANTTEMISN